MAKTKPKTKANAKAKAKAKLPFRRVIEDDKAYKTIGAVLVPDDSKPVAILLKGKCPRCHDQTEWRHSLFSFPGVSEVKTEQLDEVGETLGLDRSQGDENVHAVCTCGEEHPGERGTETGCGARFTIRVTWPKKNESAAND